MINWNVNWRLHQLRLRYPVCVQCPISMLGQNDHGKKKEKKKIDVSSNMSKRRVIRGVSDMNIAAELNIGGLQALRNGGMKKSWELGII